MTKKRKLNEISLNLLEDAMSISEEAKLEIHKARREVRQGKVKKLAQIKAELGID